MKPAAAKLKRWREDIVLFVRDTFHAEPDAWQLDALRACARDKRIAMKACKGPGKSTVLAWFLWWGIALHSHSQQLALSITRDNLRDNLWKELAVWYAKSPWLQHEFDVDAQRIAHRANEKTWWISARSFPQSADTEQQANTLAGLHAQRYVAIVCDESSDYPDGVLAAAEGIFANEGVEAHLVQSGNPTRTEGPLYNACTKDRHRWTVIEITGDPDDPKRSPRISLEYAREAIASWGRENPWVMTNILGLFPNVASDKLCGPNDITAAENRTCGLADFASEPVIWGLDVARFGDDKSHLRKRQGIVLFRGYDFRNLNGVELASRVSVTLQRNAEADRHRPDALFVDVTGGVGASAFDHLQLMGWSDILCAVEFAGTPDEPRFQNKRAEMWWRAAEWTRQRGCIPSGSAELGRDLCGPSYSYKLVGKRTVFALESKDDMKKRGLPSPDEGDAVALTFTSTTVVRREERMAFAHGQAAGMPPPTKDWDPFEEVRA